MIDFNHLLAIFPIKSTIDYESNRNTTVHMHSEEFAKLCKENINAYFPPVDDYGVLAVFAAFLFFEMGLTEEEIKRFKI